MKTRLVALVASIVVFSAAFLLAPPAAAQQGGRTKGRSGHTAQNRPRANQGRIPKAPPARNDPAGQRQTEHLPTGHVNDMPHVNHDQWFGHEQPNDTRFHLDKPFPNGRFAKFGSRFRYAVTRIDPDLHRFWFPGGFYCDGCVRDRISGDEQPVETLGGADGMPLDEW
jgi:hypothetical protein